jgi:hypothetical protein
LSLPIADFTLGDLSVEAFTLENKSDGSYEVMFIDKSTQKSLGSYTVQNPALKAKGAAYDIQAFFDFVTADFKKTATAA